MRELESGVCEQRLLDLGRILYGYASRWYYSYNGNPADEGLRKIGYYVSGFDSWTSNRFLEHSEYHDDAIRQWPTEKQLQKAEDNLRWYLDGEKSGATTGPAKDYFARWTNKEEK